MKKSTINGVNFYNAFRAGAQAIICNREHLNKINVFPVSDADTGNNLVHTIQSILEKTQHSESLKDTLDSLAANALAYARGNSGIIFSQYLCGLSKEICEDSEATIDYFAKSARNAVKYLYDSITEPVEGTMLTDIRDWADSLFHHSSKNHDFFVVLKMAFKDAVTSLNNTPNLLKKLAEHGVLDAGAQGFVNFLEGVINYILNGCHLNQAIETVVYEDIPDFHDNQKPAFRYCCEAVLNNLDLSLNELRKELQVKSDSLILAGDSAKIHLHIHHNHPDELFAFLDEVAKTSQIKVDDMLLQYDIAQNRKYSLGLIADSACDLPEEWRMKYQILTIPFGINFGDRFYLDKTTINAEQFYNKLKSDLNHPQSNQPSPALIESILQFAASHFEKTFSIHISRELSGIFNNIVSSCKKYSQIQPVNSKNLSVSSGLLTYRIADAIEKKWSFEEINLKISEWTEKSRIFTDISTLKYMVKGGRVSPLQGFAAKILNLKPIVSVDENGKGIAYGKSFSRKSNMKKILNIITNLAEKNEIWNYAIVHADNADRAQKYAERLTEILKKEPAYVMPLSPVVGVHNGIGAVGIGIMLE
ncbi:MAG: DegV family protein [Candidatus Cloacimonetes bacterium]|nr:DegV family protein [Candidatus Cloacimonadota bacterium]